MFKHENQIGNWYANKGKGIFLKISIIFAYISLFLTPITLLALGIVFSVLGIENAWICFVVIPFALVGNYFLVCFTKGEYVLFKRINGETDFELEIPVKKEKTKVEKTRNIKVKDTKGEEHVVAVKETINVGDKVSITFDTKASPLDQTIIPANSVGVVGGFSGKYLLVEFKIDGQSHVVSLAPGRVNKVSE